MEIINFIIAVVLGIIILQFVFKFVEKNKFSTNAVYSIGLIMGLLITPIMGLILNVILP